MKIKKTVILNKKKGIIPFIKSYFEARIQKKKTFHCNYIFYRLGFEEKAFYCILFKEKYVAWIKKPFYIYNLHVNGRFVMKTLLHLNITVDDHE